MTDPPDPTDLASLRELILGLHTKLDAMRVSYRRILRDRLKDRDTVQRHDRRIESLEHQVALLTAQQPSMTSWRPSTQDLKTSEHTAVEIAELDFIDDED